MKKAGVVVLTAMVLLVFIAPGHAQRGLYIGGDFGTCSLGGDLADVTKSGGGFNVLLGFKVTHRIAVELEFHASELEPDNDVWDKTVFAGFGLNFKKFFARPRQAFKPYFVGGLGINGFAWEYTSEEKTKHGVDGDGIGALSITPGFGFELMVGRIAALNMCGRFFLNMWGDETAEGHKATYDSGNAFILNLGLILHL